MRLSRPVLAVLLLGALLFAVLAMRMPARPFTEDGFYDFSIARHIALGHGITIDGTTWTNGFQPLWVMLLVPLAWTVHGDRLAFLRLVLCLSGAIWVAAALTVSRLAAHLAPAERAASAATLALILYVTDPLILRQHFNGLETGLLLLVLANIGLLFSRPGVWTIGRTAQLAVLTGVMVLCRIDTAMLVPLLMAAVAWLSGGPALVRLARATAIGAASVLISAPWWLYNVRGFGRLLPSSGSAVFDWHWDPGRARAVLLAAAAHGLPLPIRPVWPWHYDWCAAAVLAIGAILTLRSPSRGATSLKTANRGAAIFMLLLVCYTAVIIGAYAMSPAWWMYDRYTSPVVLVSVPLLAGFLARHVRTMPRTAVLAVAAAAVEAAFVVYAVRAPSRKYYQAQIELVARHVPPDDRVGAFQSGTLGYFRDRVVNLDGKVNAQALAARGRMDAYTRAIGVNWIVDFPVLVQEGFGSLDDWTLVEQVEDAHCPSCGFALYKRRPSG